MHIGHVTRNRGWLFYGGMKEQMDLTVIKKLAGVGALGVALVFTGCAPFTVQHRMEKTLSSGNSFSECLAREYQDRAHSEAYRDGNWADSQLFVERMQLAAAGQSVSPLNPDDFAVADHRADLEEAYRLLVTALRTEGSENCVCARTQRYFDGWVEQASDNKLGVGGSWFGGSGGSVQPAWTLAERAAFYESLDACELSLVVEEEPVKVSDKPKTSEPEAIKGSYTVYFAFDKSDLTPEAKTVIKEVVSLIYGADTYSVDVVGHTDTVGTVQYNLKLGQRRADAVEKFLMQQGVKESTITTTSRGKSELEVQTKDQIREPRNRRAVITVGGEK